MEKVLFSLWFFLPAGLANCAPIFAAKLPGLRNLNYPVDFYKKLQGKRILGDHKTIRGFIVAILVGVAIAYIQVLIYQKSEFIRGISTVDYSQINFLVLGSLLGFGAIFGDATKSFFKRRFEIQSGKPWIPFDQIDYIIGGLLFSIFYIQLDFFTYFLIFIIWTVLHPISTITGYLLGLKKDPI